MKCFKCGADLTEGTEKCPFCKEILEEKTEGISGNFDFKYTITSKEQMKLIRDAVNSKEKKHFSFKPLPKADSKKNKPKKAGKLKGNLKNISPQNKMYIFFYGTIFLIILLVLGIWTGAAAVANRKRTVYPIVYSKGNSIYMQYEKKNVLLTENAVDQNVLFNESEENKTEVSEVKNNSFESLAKEDTVKKSENGMYVYFYENYDIKKHSGSLIRIFNGKEKRVVANDVFNSYVLSQDGKEVLYLQSADENGDMGNLFYWNEKQKEPVKIAGDIDKNTFGFSKDGEGIVFLKNYNHKDRSGDLCVISKNKTTEESTILASEVSEFFCADFKRKIYFYSKNFDEKKGCYDLYIKRGEKAAKLFEAAVKKPIVPEKGNEVLVYGYDDGDANLLYSVNYKNYAKNKIAQVTDVLKTDEKNKKVIFNKVQENSVTDCYYYEPGRKILKIADNITAVSEENKGANLFSFSENFKKAAYITSFDNGKSGGKLCVVDLTKTKDNISEISDDVFSCYMSKDGKKLYFCKDYSKARQIFDVYSTNGKSIKNVAEDVESLFFAMTPNRKRGVFLKDSGIEGSFGCLYITDKNDNVREKYEKTDAFAVLEDESVVIFENGKESGNRDLSRTNKKGGKKTIIDKDISGLLCY